MSTYDVMFTGLGGLDGYTSSNRAVSSIKKALFDTNGLLKIQELNQITMKLLVK